MAEGFAQGSKKSYGATRDEPLPDVSFAGSHYNQGEQLPAALIDNITSKVQTICSSWKQLQQASKNIGTHKDSKGLRDEVKVTQLSTNQIIDQTKKDIKKLAGISRQKGDMLLKLQINRLTSMFKEAVETYSSVQKEIADKMKFCQLPSELALIEDSNRQFDYSDDAEKSLMRNRQSEIRDLEFEQGMILEREQQVRRIENEIIDVNQIMRELGSVVYQQAESINSIENAIENVAVGVQSAEEELEKAATYQNKRRKSAFKLAVIAIVCLLILLLLVYISLR
ncbi:syntaxin PEP12 [Nilaparvata lugens]|uniref:syntaxin PEP12 n=1 Tax=Nilaparvata lugens TaxID=108931 RepID=UPI000B980575|nr:syntaxin PEP12 [Nilaparvata lugens]